MRPKSERTFLATATALAMCCCAMTGYAQSATDIDNMSFFVTSDGLGDGGNLGGLEGADAHCNALAEAAGSTKSWAAYLSTSMVVDRSNGRPFKITNGISARNRIGDGPWHNANGVLIASDVDALHSSEVNINCLLYTSPSPRDRQKSRMPSSA